MGSKIASSLVVYGVTTTHHHFAITFLCNFGRYSQQKWGFFVWGFPSQKPQLCVWVLCSKSPPNCEMLKVPRCLHPRCLWCKLARGKVFFCFGRISASLLKRDSQAPSASVLKVFWVKSPQVQFKFSGPYSTTPISSPGQFSENFLGRFTTQKGFFLFFAGIPFEDPPVFFKTPLDIPFNLPPSIICIPEFPPQVLNNPCVKFLLVGLPAVCWKCISKSLSFVCGQSFYTYKIANSKWFPVQPRK